MKIIGEGILCQFYQILRYLRRVVIASTFTEFIPSLRSGQALSKVEGFLAMTGFRVHYRKIELVLLLALTILIISTANAKAAEELLKVDKTLIIQLVIFIAAIFILNSLLFKPLLELLEKREKLTTGRIEEAKDFNEKVEQIMKEYKAKLDEVRAKALEERNEIRREAQAAAEEIIGKARKEAQVLLEEAKARLELEAKEIRAKIKPEIEVLAREMASQVLGREI